jgi:hypothetical protein
MCTNLSHNGRWQECRARLVAGDGWRLVVINDLGVSLAYSTSKHPQLESFKRTLTSYDNRRRRMVLFSAGKSPLLRAGTLCTHYLGSYFLLYLYLRV